MDAMKERLTTILHQTTGRRPPDLRVSLRTPLEHQSNRLYDAWADGRHLIVKEYLKPEEFDAAPVREHRALGLLAPLDVAPRPVALDAHGDEHAHPVVVYEYLDGEMWDRRRPSIDELAALAETWLKLHAIPRDQAWVARGHVPRVLACPVPRCGQATN